MPKGSFSIESGVARLFGSLVTVMQYIAFFSRYAFSNVQELILFSVLADVLL